MIAVLLGVAALAVLLLFLNWFTRTEPRVVLRALFWGGLAAVGLFIAVMAATGRLGWLFALAPLLAPMVMRARAALQRAKAFRRMAEDMAGGDGATAGRASEVRTRLLHAVLDHGTGALDAEVLEGPFAGRRLSGMDVGDLRRLLDICRNADPQSAGIIETHLERAHPGWRAARDGAEAEPHPPPRARAGMTREEALRVLGLPADADVAAVRAAYHRLMAAVHPDRGGSSFLAAQLNEARDVLLGP